MPNIDKKRQAEKQLKEELESAILKYVRSVRKNVISIEIEVNTGYFNLSTGGGHYNINPNITIKETL